MAVSPGNASTNWRRSLPAPSDPASESHKTRQRGALYGRRKGPKLSAHQAALIESLLPQLKLDPQLGADPANYFGIAVDDVWLEIGFGAGEHLLWQSRHRPNVGFIGAEPYQAGVAKLLSKLDTLLARACVGEADREAVEGAILSGDRPPPPLRGTSTTLRAGEEKKRGNYISRLRVYEGDARDVIEALPNASLGRVFLLFPDPWPKTRHHKRRIIQVEMLDQLERVMKPGAEFRFASDDPGYVEWTLERILSRPDFSWTATRSESWRSRPPDWPPTRYEEKALHGVPVFLRFIRL
jgi:tRNA (guanine-N7-)-methyltransferase